MTYISNMPPIEMSKKRRNMAALPIRFLIAGSNGKKTNAGIVPNHIKTVVISGVAPMLYDIK